ncbi:MAG: L,D-transpeptidase [Candidatus Desulfatibia sp.]|uniref:L,D-transpeptidase family protein n=1 Tax=Candidatus Desulfatibia sp. TaxID=3101189 RepID=UPI002F2F20BC
MRKKADRRTRKKSSKKSWTTVSILLGATILLLGLGLKIFSADSDHPVPSQETDRMVFAKAVKQRSSNDGLWDGPILYHQAGSEPINLILVEKAIQKVHLYRYDGRYQHIKSYSAATGEKQGKKRREKDEKTPEGIYFTTKIYRDNKITIFGDRAFGLNYPDVFDKFEGNGGSGIFVHGSNKEISPFSTNGCVALNNDDIVDLDKRIQFKKTPVIIGERLPYRFKTVERDISELIPFFKKAMVPEKYAHLKSDFSSLTVLGFGERVVATGTVRIKEAGNIQGVSRLYLAGPGKNLLVLVKREWDEKKVSIVSAKAKPRPVSQDKTRIASLVKSWRKAWEGKKLNAYIAYYHPAFKSGGKDRAAWKSYKGRLNKNYRWISIKISGLKVKQVDSRKAFAYFKQSYSSNTFRSDRFKRLEFRKKGTSWKIFRERTFPTKLAGWPS